MSYNYDRIIGEIATKHQVRLAKSVISNWVRESHTPRGGVHLFEPKASPELAYVIGAETGDASLHAKTKNYQYRVRLNATDREFVEEFDRAVSAVLGCRHHRIWKRPDSEFYVEIGSYLLYRFLRQPFEELRLFIEHCKKCAAAFLRGFFDSEGCVDTRMSLSAYNTDVNLLKYVQGLLLRVFRIETTGPRVSTKKGSPITRRGRTYFRRSDCYSIYVRKRSIAIFYHEIGLTIQRKKVRLKKAISFRELNFNQGFVG
jgi:intein-encoded DNA endonuclease-like protein